MNRKLGPNWGYPQFRVIFAQKLGWGWVGGCKFSKIVVKVGVAKLKKIVVDVEVGVTISKKNWAMVGVGEVFGYKIVVLLWLWVV